MWRDLTLKRQQYLPYFGSFIGSFSTLGEHVKLVVFVVGGSDGWDCAELGRQAEVAELRAECGSCDRRGPRRFLVQVNQLRCLTLGGFFTT